jgi:hypothetical protein
LTCLNSAAKTPIISLAGIRCTCSLFIGSSPLDQTVMSVIARVHTVIPNRTNSSLMLFGRPQTSGFLMFVVLHDVLGGNRRLFEAAINLAQLPEDQNKENRDHKQQELDVHFFSSSNCQGIVEAKASSPFRLLARCRYSVSTMADRAQRDLNVFLPQGHIRDRRPGQGGEIISLPSQKQSSTF